MTTSTYSYQYNVGAFNNPAESSMPSTEAAGVTESVTVSDKPGRIRRWEGADTSRLNQYQWADAQPRPINADLISDLSELRGRCSYEAYNNPIVEGVIKTHTIDLIGESGPTLQVMSESAAYNRALQELWADWWAAPETSDEMSGVDLLEQFNWSSWTRGPILAQIVTDQFAPTRVRQRLLPIDAEQLQTPAEFLGDPRVLLGVRRSKLNRAQEFYIAENEEVWPFSYLGTSFRTLPREDVIHAFEPREAGQSTGFPLLASAIQEIADLRQFGLFTMDAVRRLALNALVATSTQPEHVSGAQALPTGTTIPLHRDAITVMQPGYQMQSGNPTHPGPQYVEYVHERLRALGRPVHMPLLVILLSAEQSNFSQSRLDVNVFYERGLKVRRNWLARRVLNRCLGIVEQEGRLIRANRSGRFILPPRPARVDFRWHWEPMAQADELKHVQAIAAKLTAGLMTLPQALAEVGVDFEPHFAELLRVNQMMLAAGLQPIFGTQPPPEPETANNNAAEDNRIWQLAN